MTSQAELGEPLRKAMSQLGLAWTDHQEQQLLDYVDQLHKWNQIYNLTSIKRKEDMLVQHVIDSLSVVPAVYALLADRDVKEATHTPRIMDVGSGGGLPGMVLAIMCDAEVYCVDAVQKKTTFLQQMKGVLKLPNLFSQHGRVEKMPSCQAKIVISRAFSSLADFARLAGHHVRPNGVMLAMKGKYPDQEVLDLHATTGWRVVQQQQLDVPGLSADRCLLHMRTES